MPITAEETLTLTGVAKNIFEELGNTDRAIQKMMDVVNDDYDLNNQAVWLACKNILDLLHRNSRTDIIKEAEVEVPFVPKTYSREQQEDIVRRCSRFMQWRLFDGTLLKDATKEKLLEQHEIYQKQIKGTIRNDRFVLSISDGLRDGQKVGDRYTEGELKKLMVKAKRKN